ncbi:MAG: ParB N-terminal domain-containing protein [Gemmatimonadaceae bacterium]
MAEIKQVAPRRVGELLIDPENPRLPPDLDTTDQDALLRHFDENYNLDELAASMVEEGFFSEEPLLIVPAGDDEKWIVVEGNRRLATLKLLLEPESRAMVDRAGHWEGLAAAAEERRDQLDPIPTFEYGSRDELLEYLGFRHVTGVVPWTAEAKARYIVDLVRRGHTFPDIARAIGSRQDAVKRQFAAWSALDQAGEAGQPVDQAKRFFGVFYRALQSPAIRRYLRLKEPAEISEEETELITAGEEDRVAELSSWLFGRPGTDERAVITDSRQLTNLGRVLENEQAATMLRETRDFQLALDVAGGDRASIETALTRARSSLVVARGHAFEFAGDRDVIERTHGVDRVVHTILEILGEPSDGGEDGAAAADAGPES